MIIDFNCVPVQLKLIPFTLSGNNTGPWDSDSNPRLLQQSIEDVEQETLSSDLMSLPSNQCNLRP